MITPSLNQGQFLQRTIESVLFQENCEFEHIVVDGVSDDESRQILQRYDDCITWTSESDHCQAQAVNRGFAQSRGEILGWLNSDDVFQPGALRQVCDFFRSHPDVDVVYGNADFIDEDGDPISPYRARRCRRSGLLRRISFCQPAVFFRRRIIERYGLLDESVMYRPDYEYWLRLCHGGAKFAQLTVQLADCRVHDGNRCEWAVNSRLIAAEKLECTNLIAKRFDVLPTRWLIASGQAMAELHGHDRISSISYDRNVLPNALREARQLDRGTLTQFSDFVRLFCNHVGRELMAILRRPHVATRFLPNALGRPIQRFLRRKIFRLKHHTPRPLAVATDRRSDRVDSDMPVISIVTPSFNQVEYLSHTIESIVNQKYAQLEYIVQDGGSTDGSAQVLENHSYQFKHWCSAPDGGQSQAINLGMQHATGEIMAFLNSDDILLPGSLDYVVEYFRQNPAIDVLYGHRVLIDESGAEIGRWVLPPHDDKLLAWVDYIPQETMFWRRSAWETIGAKIDESFHFALDWDLILRFRAAGLRFARVPRFLGAFRVSDTQKTNQFIHSVGRLEMKRLRKQHLGRVPSNREMRRAMRPYLRRHWLFDKLYLLGIIKYQ
ncbi:MAG: glycosyltransferase family 2 protein [Pirellulales bacterium]